MMRNRRTSPTASLRLILGKKEHRWLAENANALASSNEFANCDGLPLGGHRQF